MAGFSEDFKRKLQSESLPVSKDLWARLDGKLDASDKKKKSAGYYFMAIAAGLALLLVAVFGVRNFLHNGVAAQPEYAASAEKKAQTEKTNSTTDIMLQEPDKNTTAITLGEHATSDNTGSADEVPSVINNGRHQSGFTKKADRPVVVGKKEELSGMITNGPTVSLAIGAPNNQKVASESRQMADIVPAISSSGLKSLGIQKVQEPVMKKLPDLHTTNNPGNVVVVVEKEDLSDKIYSFISNKAEKVVSKIERKKSGLLPDEINIIY